MQTHNRIRFNAAAAVIATLFIVGTNICTHCYANAAGAASAPAATATPAPPAKTKHTALAPVFANPATIGDAPAGSAAPEQELTDAEKKALIKESQNPVGNIAILPFQNNWNYAVGPTKTTLWDMNIEPVVPFMLSPKANLIERVITPVINVSPLLSESDCLAAGISTTTPPCGAKLGIGNIQLQSFYAPKTNPNGFIWGAGPIFSFPTVSQRLGTQQFGGGINVVGLVMPGSWVMGMLVTQRWYIAGPSAPAQNTLNSFLAQPFINYNFGKGWALSTAPEISASWNSGGDKWTVPVGMQISNTNTWLKLPMTYALAYYGNVVRPQNAPYGLIRFNWAILWPVKRGG
jgi:hypothetical protein